AQRRREAALGPISPLPCHHGCIPPQDAGPALHRHYYHGTAWRADGEMTIVCCSGHTGAITGAAWPMSSHLTCTKSSKNRIDDIGQKHVGNGCPEWPAHDEVFVNGCD